MNKVIMLRQLAALINHKKPKTITLLILAAFFALFHIIYLLTFLDMFEIANLKRKRNC